MSKISTYIQDIIAEMKHVSWPSREQAIAYTVLVIAISFGVAFFLYVFDQLFLFLLF